MKKRFLIIPAIIIAALLIPVPTGVYKDGGTRTYTALTYKIVDWNRITDSDTPYNKTKVYWFPHNFKSLDDLWFFEEDEVEYTFAATVLEVYNGSVLVMPDDNEPIAKSCDKISFGTTQLPYLDVNRGSRIWVTYQGYIMESYPAQIHATRWEPLVTKDCGTFLYEDIYANYHGKPGVKEYGFVNVEKTEVNTGFQAEELAKNECTVDYDLIYIDFDYISRIYRVSFEKEGVAGGGQEVYINEDGITLLIIYGE